MGPGDLSVLSWNMEWLADPAALDAADYWRRCADAGHPNRKLRDDLPFCDVCSVPCDHVPVRSWPLFRAREVMPALIKSLRQELRS